MQKREVLQYSALGVLVLGGLLTATNSWGCWKSIERIEKYDGIERAEKIHRDEWIVRGYVAEAVHGLAFGVGERVGYWVGE